MHFSLQRSSLAKAQLNPWVKNNNNKPEPEQLRRKETILINSCNGYQATLNPNSLCFRRVPTFSNNCDVWRG